MIINDDVSFGFTITNLLDDLSWLSHDYGERIMLLVVFVDKGGGEVATVLQHLYHVPHQRHALLITRYS